MPQIGSVIPSPPSTSQVPSQHLTSNSISPSFTKSEIDVPNKLTPSSYACTQYSQGINFDTNMMGVEGFLNSRKEFICGSGAAFINICVTFPLNKAIFRQQLHGVSTIRALRQLQKDGLRYLYRGLLPPLLQKTASMAIMFGSYTRNQELVQNMAPSLPTIYNHLIAALMAGTLEAVLCPFERIQTLMQNRHFHGRFTNTFDAFKSLRSFGLFEYYRGLSVIIMRNGPSNVFFFLGKECLETKGPEPRRQSVKILRDFISGACLGALISSFFFPFNVVKTHMQSQLGGPFRSFVQTFKIVLNVRGGMVRKMFKGVHLNYTRSFISWGIINASYEFLLNTFFERSVR